MRRVDACVAAAAALLLGARAVTAQNTTNVLNTKHNLSSTGPGEYRAAGETRVCVFCHTPHNAAAGSPLWNKDLEPQTYQVYASPTSKLAQKLGTFPQPTGPTKLCLSCHDGTIALGAVLNPTGGITMSGSGAITSGSLSNFGLDLRGHHPVSFSYRDALPNPELAPSPPSSLPLGGKDEVHCTTCHDPHNDRWGRFLVQDNRGSALCVACHRIPGWEASAHATSTASVLGVLPRPPKDWPSYSQLSDWGCESCHTPHFAPTAPQLLVFSATPPVFECTSSGCHGSDPGSPHLSTGPGPAFASARTGRADIGTQVRKASAHHLESGVASSTGGESGNAGRTGVRRVVCADCHDPHLVTAAAASLPNVSGLLLGVSGVDRTGTPVRPARFEYEVCFKCHGDSSGDLPAVVRAFSETNLRHAFDQANPSFHPVIVQGRSDFVPSIPSSLSPGMTASQLIGCTSCHADDSGVSRGPHGSSYAPILKERYESADGTAESYENYALCYRCHERSSILADASFRRRTAARTPSAGGHSGHLRTGASCAACHDPHGVRIPPGANPSQTGDGTHLVNFDLRTVAPLPGAPYPVYRQTGMFSGTCALTCHGFVHDGTNSAYP